MLFNSLEFSVFLPIVFTIYWLLNANIKIQNIFLLFASYVFYAWWNWQFLSLIIISSFVDFFVGKKLHRTTNTKKRKLLLWVSIVVNIGILAYFKYSNFFIHNFIEAFSLFGKQLSINSLKIVLPVGISFYTFQTLSYTIDVYRRKLEPTHDIIAFFAYVAFFPQLVAGPIERAKNLLPQFFLARQFDYNKSMDGMRQILWGLFKKIVIADSAAFYVNKVFENSDTMPGSALFIGAVLFAFQIYGDFSGYSDIAIGTARLFGFNLLQNFAFPYFSRDIAEFWRRWHISLSTWFRDYVYFPLGGSKCSRSKQIRNVLIIFIVSGFWHGANWTFIIWGVINALYFLPLMFFGKNRKNIDIVAKNKIFPGFRDLLAMGTTFLLTIFAWIFFRAETLTHAISYLQNMFSYSFFSFLSGFYAITIDVTKIYLIFIYIFIAVIVEWINREKQHGLEIIVKNNKLYNKILRGMFYIFLCVFIILNTRNEAADFIYFQF